jgi:hypothetical protein
MTLRRFALLAFALVLLAVPASAQAHHRVASAIGEKQVGGQTVYVDVLVVVSHGQSDQQATDKALADQGARRAARPPWAGGGGGGTKERYFYTGLKWNPASVTQNYNPANEPFAAKPALVNTHADWSTITDSTYSITAGLEDTDRCPSLVDECAGAQTFDGNEDVGWLQLGSSTLGVTWYSTSGPPEADMALNTRFSWSNSCTQQSGKYDVETVFLHENGHVAGLDHPNRTDSVMYASYQTATCSLFPYDQRSMANLY